MTHLTLQAVTKRFNTAYAVDHVDHDQGPSHQGTRINAETAKC